MSGKLISILIFVFFLKGKIEAQAVNIDFESSLAGTYTAGNSVNGWSLSSQTATNCGSSTWTSYSTEFSLVTTPILNFPVIGYIPNSPLGGNIVASLNNQTANSSVTKLSQSVWVTTSNSNLQIAYAGVLQNHSNALCCEESGFKLLLRDQNNSILSCSSLTASGSSCQNVGVTFSTTSGGTTNWTNWQVKYIDLTPYINSAITIEIIANDCTSGDHYGTLLCDLKLGAMVLAGVCYYPPVSGVVMNPVEYCAGSSVAKINAPLGYATYSWQPPAGILLMPAQATLSSISVTNPVIGGVYSVTMMQSNSQCAFTTTYAILPSTVSVLAAGAGSTCAMGSSGSATVFGSGSATGYNYTWYNSTNSVVGTNSIVTNLSAGVYSVTITSAGSTSATCGSSSSNATVTIRPSVPLVTFKTFCGNTAYFSALTTGTNYQWYYNQVAISASLNGTSSSFTINSATAGSIVTLGYTNEGCRDSVQYILYSAQPGSLVATNNPMACPNGTNGSITLSLTPSAGAPTGSNVFYLGSGLPSYSAVSSSGNSNTITVGGLSPGGGYNAYAFDGSCYYNLSFSVTPYNFSVALTAPTSNTLCYPAYLSNNAIPNPYSVGQYSFLWMPNVNLFGSVNTSTNVLVMLYGILPPGTQTTVTYSLVVTPTAINCPQTSTFNVTFANPITPSISPIPNLCNSLNTYTISANPPGGIFSNNSAVSPNGIIMPAAAAWGLNTFTYANTIGTCAAQTSGSFVVYSGSPLQISGNTIICEGQSTTLLASGANTYTWNGSNSGPIYVTNPATTSIYTVTGTNNYSCPSTFIFTVAVTPLPTLSLFGDTAICKGESTILYASGAHAYNWNGNANSSTISVSPLVNTTYIVTGINNPGSCTSNEAISVVVVDCVDTGIEETPSQYQTSIYPNPGSGLFFIELHEDSELSVYNALGRIVLREEKVNGKYILDLRNYSNGNYFIKLSNRVGSHYTRLVKYE